MSAHNTTYSENVIRIKQMIYVELLQTFLLLLFVVYFPDWLLGF